MRKVTPPPAVARNGDLEGRGAKPTNGHEEASGREVILNGRRYLLLPVDERAESAPSQSASSPALVLTARELQIVTLVADGLVNKQVAAALRISEWTVSTHLRRIYAKLHVDTRAAMVSRCASVLSQAAEPGHPAPN